MADTFQSSGIEAQVKNLNAFLGDIGKMDKAMAGIGSNTKAISDWNNSITSVAANVGKVVAAGAAIATTAITAFVADSIGKATDLQAQISGIGAVLGKTAEEVTPLKTLIENLGLDPKLKVSATEAADAVEMLARNGLDMNQIMNGAARATVLLGNSVGSDLSMAADIATDTMAIFNIEAKDMDKAVNGITGVVNTSKFSIEDYALALAQGGGVASAVGVSFDDFNTTIAAISPLFSSGSDAGTSLKTMLQRLIPASDPARDAMRDLGLFTGLSREEFEKAEANIKKYKDQLEKLDPTTKSYSIKSEELREKITALESSLITGSNAFFDANGQMKDMDVISGILSEATKGLSEEQKNEALSTIFGTDAMRAAIGVANTGQEKFLELKGAIGDTSAEESAATRMDNLRGSLEILSGIVETLQLKIGEKFIPVVRKITDWASNFLSTHADEIVAFFGNLADRVSDAIDIFIPMVEQWLPKLGDKFNDAQTFVKGLIEKFGDVRTKVGEFIGKIQDAIQPMADWLKKNYDANDILTGIATLITVSLIPAIASFIATITPVILLIGSVAKAASNLSDEHKWLAGAIAVAVVAIPPLVSAIGAIISIVTGAAGLISGIGAAGAAITGGGGMVAALGALLNPVGLVVAAGAGLALAWKTDFLGIRTDTVAKTEEIGRRLSSWGETAKTNWNGFTTSIKTGWQAGLQAVGDFTSHTKDRVVALFSKTKEESLYPLRQLTDGAVSSVKSMSSQTIDTTDGWQRQMNTIISTMADNGVYESEGMKRQIVAELTALKNEGSNLTDQTKSKITQSLRQMATEATSSGQAMNSDVVGHIKQMRTSAIVDSDALRERMAENARKTKDSVVQTHKDLTNDVIGEVTRMGTETQAKGKQAGGDVAIGVKQGVEQQEPSVLSRIGQFGGNLLAAFRQSVDARSPSRLFADIGVDIMDGLNQGMESRAPAVFDYITAFTDRLVGTAAHAADQVVTTIEDGIAKIGDFTTGYAEDFWAGWTSEAEEARKAAEAAVKASQDAALQAAKKEADAVMAVTLEVTGDIGQQAQRIYGNVNTMDAGNIAGSIESLKLLVSTVQSNIDSFRGDPKRAEDRAAYEALYRTIANNMIPTLNTLLNQATAAADAQIQAAEEAKAKRVNEALGTSTQTISGFVNDTWSAMNKFITNVIQSGDQAALGAATQIEKAVRAAWDSDTMLQITQSLSNVGADTSASDLLMGIGEMLDFRREFKELIDRAGLGQFQPSALNDVLPGYLGGALTTALPVLQGGDTINTEIVTGDINNAMDVAMLQAIIQQALANALP